MQRNGTVGYRAAAAAAGSNGRHVHLGWTPSLGGSQAKETGRAPILRRRSLGPSDGARGGRDSVLQSHAFIFKGTCACMDGWMHARMHACTNKHPTGAHPSS
eukprot:362388-Chlamydomonas_euryale.AAC.4